MAVLIGKKKKKGKFSDFVQNLQVVSTLLVPRYFRLYHFRSGVMNDSLAQGVFHQPAHYGVRELC